MDANGHIYREDAETISAEDKARLDGYLTARAESGEFERMKAELEKATAALKEKP